ncbi:histone-lysine N-methyltransferase ASHH1 isoform X3 [Vitis vinifera]|uniref:histone-lysine N-methyltransferase ASHH1 isoform X3 n=1 Tax=Vitis vinifera TaxID=29760 RepID=UPI0008FECF9E|nr:histone-lysine N-methyltransferase ASHH1 isoform X3 [Vitis vinifera]|eukprot:XP_019072296.1 PREDICTED: histone-lysine N-methyltransferase ASHH1-like isoform X3 [Vitis vinifera]
MSQSQAPAVRRTHSRQHVASSACRIDPHGRFDQQIEGVRVYIHINKNDFSYREGLLGFLSADGGYWRIFLIRHIKQEEDDITICECKYNTNDPDSACGERCLNVLTSIECTPHYCPCSVHCKNQRFQKHEYAKTKLFRTEGRGWGLLANEDIKAGRFIIEYCGEVISWNEARERSLAYASQGINDAYIISLNARECIDATKSGSQARFINHSCEPNCETRKWSVLGEVRIGIFAMRDISIGTELTYDYNFQWYGGAKVHCLCGATSCCGFLGAKSRGFQDTDVWEDIDERNKGRRPHPISTCYTRMKLNLP